MPDDWRELNLANWESRVAVHVGEDGYQLAAFEEPAYLSHVVRYDLPRLGRLDGLDVVHLQCHIGTDTVSLSRLGVRSMTGLDFSPAALDQARRLAERAGASITYVRSDVYDAVAALGAESFDLVHTGIGAISWLPDIRRWARVVAGLLRPGGRLFLRDAHPMLLTLSEPRTDGLLVVTYPYFEAPGVLFREETSYTGSGLVTSPDSVSFNHGLAELFDALRDAGLDLFDFAEHREAPWNPLGAAMTASTDHPGEYVLISGAERLPLTFTIQARRVA